MEMENLSHRLNDSNPFEAMGFLMSALASETRRANTSGEFYELALRGNELNPADVSESAMALFLECKRILQLPFLSEHNSAVESHQKYLDSLRGTFFRMAFTYESIGPLNNFKAAWDAGRWTIMSQSVKSFRNEYQNYQLIELVRRYLTVLRGLLEETEESESVNDALGLLVEILENIDDELWKYSWQDYTDRFARLEMLLWTESNENPESTLSLFFKATGDVMWSVFNHANRAMDVLLFLPRAHACLNIALMIGSGTLTPEGRQTVEDFLQVMNQSAMPSIGSGEIVDAMDALPEASEIGEVE